ncbi:hypothetical protein P4B35_06720 [Pontiellaceae bacterium B12227]|nr:hypothetical protein [Pontiellaceae bacterium B12227]
MKNTLWTCGIAMLMAGSVVAGTAHDNAADAAYDDGWQNYDNGGSGFGAWVMGYWATNGVDRVGIGSSVDNGGASSIDTNSRSFYIHNVDGTNEFIVVYRYLNQDLAPGHTFSFDMDINWRNGYKGFRARDVGESRFFEIEVGNNDTRVIASGVTNFIGSEYNEDTQYHIAFEQSTSTGGTWKVTRSGGLSDFDSGTYIGKVNSIELYSIFTESGDQNAIYYNNFDVSYTPGFDHYGAWTNQYSLSGSDADYDADPDNDGMKNLEEFSVGRSPINDEGPSWRAPEYHGNSTNGLVYVYTRYNEEKAAAMNLDYSLVISDELVDPAWETNGFVELPPVHLFGDLVTVTNYVPTTDAAAFATLQVEAL